MRISPWSLALLASLLLSQCSEKQGVSPAPDARQLSLRVMQEVAPQVVGTWQLRRVQVVSQKGNYYQSLVPITKDTLFTDFASLTLRRAVHPRVKPAQPWAPEFEGDLLFRGTSYPVYFQLQANHAKATQQQGPHAWFLLDTMYAPGERVLDANEKLLRNLGLLGDNYSLEIIEGSPRMIWRGVNRGVDYIELQK